jgi:hypothetical protein
MVRTITSAWSAAASRSRSRQIWFFPATAFRLTQCRRFVSSPLGIFFSLVSVLNELRLTGSLFTYNYQLRKDLTCFLGGDHGWVGVLM